MSYNLPRKQPVTPTKNTLKENLPFPKASKHSLPDFDFDEDEDEELGINPLLDVDFTDLELDSQDEFSYEEEEEAYFDEDDEEEFDDDEE